MITECNLNLEGCRYANLPSGCFSDTDHFYWPRGLYRTAVEREYRELPAHKEQKCRMLHDERHATEQPPAKPPRDEMLRAIASQALREAQKER